jgi:hypothetical protein
MLDEADGLAGPDFDLWLTAARRRVDAARGARLRRAAEPSIAVTAAAGALVAEPDQAAARATLVGSLVAAGDHAAALEPEFDVRANRHRAALGASSAR